MIQTSSTFHHATTEDQLRALVARKVAALLNGGVTEDQNGAPVEVRDDPEPITAYVNHGRWVVDCDCGAGNMVEPAWGIAGCLACGRIHTNVIMPEDAQALELALSVRTRPANRNWIPGETVEDLQEETERMQPRPRESR